MNLMLECNLSFRVVLLANNNEAEFVQCLQDLEELVCDIDPNTNALIIAGDFNAHLSTLVVPRLWYAKPERNNPEAAH